jgi:glycosyltransferase involved in cell wall biosynthesis
VRVAHLTRVHRIATDSRILPRECRALADNGYHVILVAPGETNRVQDGVVVVPIKAPTSRVERMLKTTVAVYRAALRSDADILHFHDPELIPLGLLLRRRGRRKVVYDVHEDMPTLMSTKEWIPERLRRPVARLTGFVERLAARRFDLVVTATETIAQRFPASKTAVVRNYPLVAELAAADAAPYADRPNRVVYVGNVQPTRGAEQMVRAMAALPSELDATLAVAGGFNPPELEHDLRGLPGHDRVEFLGWQSRDEIRQLLGGARIGLCVLHPIDSFVAALPTKLFEYMAAGIPVVASEFPGWRTIVEGANCGLLVDPMDPAAIAEAIAAILDDPGEAQAMGQRGRAAVEAHYSWAVEGRVLLDAYARLVER